MAQLVKSHSQADANLNIELARRELINDEIELRLTPKRAQYQLPRKTCIARIEILRVRQEQLGRPRARFHSSQDLKRDEPCWINGTHRAPALTAQAFGVVPMVLRNICTKALGCR